MALSQRQSSMLALIICVIMISILYLPSLLFFSFMMLPILFLIYYDTDHERLKAKAIGSLNVVGIMHAVIYSLGKYGAISNLRLMLSDPFNWFLPLGLTGLGFLIYYTLPTIIRGWTEFWLDRKEQLLKERQEYLVSEWGVKVKGNINADTDQEYNFVKRFND